MASTIGATAKLESPKSRMGIASTAPTAEAASTQHTVPTTTVPAADAVPAALSTAVAFATAKSETSKEPPLAHSCHRRRLTRLSLRCLLCVGGCAAQGTDDNNDERTGSHTAGNSECDLHSTDCYGNEQACSHTVANANTCIDTQTHAHTIADAGTNSETKTNTDHCSSGSANTETDTKANAEAMQSSEQ